MMCKEKGLTRLYQSYYQLVAGGIDCDTTQHPRFYATPILYKKPPLQMALLKHACNKEK